MNIICNFATPPQFRSPGSHLCHLLARRAAHTVAGGLEHLTCIILVEPEDDEQTFLHEVGFSPFDNPISGLRYGDEAFEPPWAWAEHHDGAFEWISPIGNDGFAFVVLVPDSDEIDARLLAMLRQFVSA